MASDIFIDEAHSSQSGKANAKMKMALIDRDLDPDEPWDDEDELAKEMKAQGTMRRKTENNHYKSFTKR